MCRHAAYTGPEINLQQFLLDPPHSLYTQSYNAKELKYARLNADGYGFGWFDPSGIPSTYTTGIPIWSDKNLSPLARSMKNSTWLGEVRSATTDSPVHAFNTQPFCSDQYLFVHNGYIRDFHERVRPELTAMLSPAIAASIQGNTDSEYLFACLCQILHDDASMTVVSAMQQLFTRIDDITDKQESLLNLIVADGNRVYASRHAIHHESPSLYYTVDDPMFAGGQLVASEAFAPDAGWQPVPEHHILMLESGSKPELLAL